MSEIVTMFYSPIQNKVGCVLAQLPPAWVRPEWWFLIPAPDQVLVTATREQWENQLSGRVCMALVKGRNNEQYQ